MPSLITAGGLTVGAQIVSATDGALTIQSGPDGSKVNALAIDASGNTTAVAVNGTTMQQGGVAMPRMVLATAQNTTSGTSIDVTGIPSWVKRITVMFNGVSTSGTSNLRVQIGAGSVLTSGYTSSALSAQAAGNTIASDTAGFVITAEVTAATFTNGSFVINLQGSNVWVAAGNTVHNARMQVAAGSVPLGGALDRLRLTTVSGTDTFDAGSVNLLLEG